MALPIGQYGVRFGVFLGLVLVPALLVLLGLGFLIAALYLSLADDVGATGAALVAGLICLCVAIVVSLVLWLILHSSRPKQETPDAVKLALTVGEALAGDLTRASRTHRLEIIAVALAAGFAVGVSPKLRKTLKDLL